MDKRRALSLFLLISSSVGMVVCMVAWLMNLVNDRSMLGITLALSWFAIVITSLDVLWTDEAKNAAEGDK